MLSVKEKGLLTNIIKHCQKIMEKTNGLSREEFDSNDDIVEIICFNILQIGELAKNFGPEFVKQYNDVPWRHIKGMRDKVVHGYDTINMDVVWDTAIRDIKPLKDYCEKILAEKDIIGCAKGTLPEKDVDIKSSEYDDVVESFYDMEKFK